MPYFGSGMNVKNAPHTRALTKEEKAMLKEARTPIFLNGGQKKGVSFGASVA